MSKSRREHATLLLATFGGLTGCGHGSSRPDLSQVEDDGGANGGVFFGMQSNDTKLYPSVSFTLQRFGDSPPFQWQTLQTAACSDITSCTGGYARRN